MTATYPMQRTRQSRKWPSPSTGLKLQENPDLNPANWVTVPPTNSDDGTIKSIVVPAGAGNEFYRLKK